MYLRVALVAVVAYCALSLPAQAGAVIEGTAPWPGGVVKYRFEAGLLARAGGSGDTCATSHTWNPDPAPITPVRL